MESEENAQMCLNIDAPHEERKRKKRKSKRVYASPMAFTTAWHLEGIERIRRLTVAKLMCPQACLMAYSPVGALFLALEFRRFSGGQSAPFVQHPVFPGGHPSKY